MLHRFIYQPRYRPQLLSIYCSLPNGQQIFCDVPPQIIDGRTMVPLSAVATALNKDVTWNESEWRVDVKDKPFYPNTGVSPIQNDLEYMTNMVTAAKKITDAWNTLVGQWNSWGYNPAGVINLKEIDAAMVALQNPPTRRSRQGICA